MIHHMYLVPDHSYMPCDRHFGNIEPKLRKYYDTIETKHEYICLIQDATNRLFEVVEMTALDFLAFDVLVGSIIKCTP